MSLTVDAWNDMMGNFLDELATTLSDVPSVLSARTAFRVATMGKGVSKDLVMKEFMRVIDPIADRVAQKDEALVDEGHLASLEVFRGCDFNRIWRHELDEGTKEAIWNYLNTLYTIGKTCDMIPTEMMGGIEKLAMECGEQMRQGTMSVADLDPAMIGKRLAQEMGEDSEMGRTLAEAAKALQDPNSEESKQAAMLQGMLGGLKLQ